MTPMEFAKDAASFDRLALETPDADAFCSSSHWILPAAARLMPLGRSFLFHGDSGYVATMVRDRGGLRAVESLEASWGLACPLVGPRPEALAADFAQVCRRHEDAWDVLFLTGIPARSKMFSSLIARLSARYALGLGPVTQRHVASLAGGLDGFLARRSANFRRGLQRALRRADRMGIELVACNVSTKAEASALYARILEVERRTWKGQSGTGIYEGPMRRFYAGMIKRLAVVGAQRAVIARHRDEDVAYLLGAAWGSTYRALQFGFDERLRGVGLGNVVQYHQLRAACESGAITHYDLGTGGEYKERWAESTRDSVAVLAQAK